MRSMTAAEFIEWQVFDSIEPIGDKRRDLQAGIICSTLANIFIRQKGAPAFRPDDFFMTLRPEPQGPQTAAQQAGIMHLIMAAQNTRHGR